VTDTEGMEGMESGTVLRSGTTLRSAPLRRTPSPNAAMIDSGAIVKQRYVLEQIIGSGAMGQVWRSKDLMRERARNARLHVAIKLLNADCAQHPDALVGLEREASKAQDLAHPNIITVHNFDVDDDLGRAFISMECLEGESLEDVIRTARGVGLSREAALPIIDGMTEGLEYAHRKRVVHCDLKPGNVFVTSEGIPKILDFGIARAARLESAAGVAEQDGFKGFTPAYASVELIREQDPQTADDIYSLGVVVYELLTGRHPFNGLPADVAKARAMKPMTIKGLKAANGTPSNEHCHSSGPAVGPTPPSFARHSRAATCCPGCSEGRSVSSHWLLRYSGINTGGRRNPTYLWNSCHGSSRSISCAKCWTVIAPGSWSPAARAS